MLGAVKDRIKQAAARAGIEIRANPNVDPFLLQRQLVQKDDPTIFDVGAHVGDTARLYRRLFPSARIFCFEPFAASYARLARLASQTPPTRVFPLALSSAAGVATLHVNPAEATNSLLPTDAAAVRTWGEGLLESKGHVDVNTDTLDGFCAAQEVTGIDILKIDVQGSELAVLQGAEQMLRRAAIGLIYVEVIVATTYQQQRKPHEYLQLMAGLGYEWVDLFNPIRRAGRLAQFDLMFAAPSSAASASRAPVQPR